MTFFAAQLQTALAFLIIAVTTSSAQTSPKITFVDSFYRTSSGAIGPQRVIATQTYRIQIGGVDEIVISKIIAGRRVFVCEPVRLKTDSDMINITISAAIHQKLHGGTSYTAIMRIGDNETHTCEVRDIWKNNTQIIEPAMVIFGYDDHSSFKLISDEFDQERSQFNK